MNAKSSRIKKYQWGLISFFSLVILFLIHLPFLNADPDINLCCYRDAFHMEGITTIQLRNYFNLGYLSFTEGDMLLKQPFFNLTLFFPFKFFGTHLIVARLTVMITFIISMLVFAKISSMVKIIPVLCLTILLQYHIFQYTHFAMPELMAIGMILISIGFLARYVSDEKSRQQSLFFACLFSFLACCMKILYFYILILVPLSLLLFQFSVSAMVPRRHLLNTVLWLVLFSAVYFFAWYLPNASFYNYIMTVQNAMRLEWHHDLLQIIYSNVRYNLLLPQSRIFVLLCLIIFPLGLWEWFKTRDLRFKIIFIAAFLWMVLELHKIIYAYFPPRYQVSIFFSAGLMSCIVIYHFLFSAESNVKKKIVAYILLIAFCLVGATDYCGLYSRKQFAIEDVNEYMKRTVHDPHEAVLGLWAPGLTWESKSRAIPVWYNFLNDKSTMTIFKPISAIIVEPQREGGDIEFASQGIDLNAVSDSVKTFTIGHSILKLYWIKQEKK
ncbi:MAG TPA: hypothetical protein VE978_06370 [Chitinophagales bacterium]|nr:hypothetical protein [Chitinophagales bacterium]